MYISITNLICNRKIKVLSYSCKSWLSTPYNLDLGLLGRLEDCMALSDMRIQPELPPILKQNGWQTKTASWKLLTCR